MSSFTDQSPNMMEVISPEIGLPKFDALITSDEMTMQYDTANGSLEYLTPDLPTGKFFNFETSFENIEISPGASPNNTGTSPNSTRDNPNNTGTSSPPDLLYDRVKTLAETVKQEIDNLRDDRRNVPLHPQQDKQQQQTTTNNNNNNDDSNNNSKSDDNDMMEEKIRKALVKMKKLDSKLAQVIKKEKEVKGRRSRQAHTVQSDITLDDSQLVFRTQPLEGGNEIINVECIETDSYSNEADSCTNQNENESITSDGSLLQHGKSFIQRNKELASEKGDILLTETEKQRLEELLDEEEDVQDNDNDNGYCYTDQERIQVDKIDRALQNIFPTTNGSLVINNSSSVLTINKGCGPGEEVLALLQWDRSEQLRLKEINDKLSMLQQQQYNDTEDAVDFGYDLTEDQLSMLLEQYNIEKLDTHTNCNNS